MKIFMIVISFFFFTTCYAKNYKIKKVKVDEVKITPIEKVKNTKGKDVEIYNENKTRHMGWGNILQGLADSEKALADYNNEEWLDGQRAKWQEMIDLLNEAKQMLLDTDIPVIE